MEQLNDLKSSIAVNESKLIQEKEEYQVNKENFIRNLESEREVIKRNVKQNNELTLNGVQTQGESVKANMITQLNSLKDINRKLSEQKTQLTTKLDLLSQEKAQRLKAMEADMIKNYELTGNENLSKIETAYINTIKNQELDIKELTNKKKTLTDTIQRLEQKKNNELQELCGKLKRTNGKIGEE